MEEIKNDIENLETDAQAAEADTQAAPEEVIEVVLQDSDTEADDAEAEETAEDTYSESELSGLTEAQRKKKIIFDKITTALLVLLLISPIAILSYILLWFVLR